MISIEPRSLINISRSKGEEDENYALLKLVHTLTLVYG